MQILVIGASGALGRPLVTSLRSRGVAVRAACRHPEQAADLAALGAEVVAADLIDRASLQRACQGVDRVLMAAHSILGRGRWRSQAVDDAGVRALIEVARDAGVQRFVYCSGSALAGPAEPARRATAASEAGQNQHPQRDGTEHGTPRLGHRDRRGPQSEREQPIRRPGKTGGSRCGLDAVTTHQHVEAARCGEVGRAGKHVIGEVKGTG